MNSPGQADCGQPENDNRAILEQSRPPRKEKPVAAQELLDIWQTLT